jgi:hypothetical protein
LTSPFLAEIKNPPTQGQAPIESAKTNPEGWGVRDFVIYVTPLPSSRIPQWRRRWSLRQEAPKCRQTRAELFPGKPSAFANKHSRKLVDDWHVDTNLNPDQMRGIFSATVAAAGFSLGKDVKINWKRTQTS